ncbi:A/G-specific DNA-adenine glycosylase [Humitalea rosea]|uniref:Adenine DNA glycosylase n=1 Tax=Humitalea rosea TaxID=990373 RepID=A0A2W7IRV7_9PROT|nr:A/G-specific DNA-adenine glycosylase [Humitalea rosea]
MPDPYQVWLSEVMLQQTTVAAVAPRFQRFLGRFPTVAALAAAPAEAVMEEWAGLGYYARARALHAAARAIAAAGAFPPDAAGWRELPGIGPYTAAAVAAIALGQPEVPVDGNVERVVARLFAVTEPMPRAKKTLAALAQGFSSDPAMRARPGDFAQALFDLGATICTPKNPACALCPWREGCAGQAMAADLPVRAEKVPRPMRHGAHFLALDGAGRVLLGRRPGHGLLGGMADIPGTAWTGAPWTDAEALAEAPFAAPWAAVPGVALHGFTHFQLTMRLFWARVEIPGTNQDWRPLAEAARILPTVFRRLLVLAEGAGVR